MYRFLVLVLVLAACGSSETDLETSFCDILASGPFDDLVATSTTADAPTSTLDDRAADVDLTSGTFIAFTPDEAGSYVFGLSDDVDFVVVDEAGEPLVRADEVLGADCDTLAVRSTWNLTAATYYLSFDTTAASVLVTAEESDDDL